MERMGLALFILTTSTLIPSVLSHGRLVDPPSRNAMWMYGFSNPKNFNPNEMNCGGTKNQWQVHGGKCGLCGDPYQGPRKHESGYPGGYSNGIIGRVYKQGQHINVMIEVTANHFGWFEFRLCPNNNPNQAETQECFDRYVLADANGEKRHRLYLTGYKGTVRFTLVLPPALTCSQCVLQWFWYGGNSRDRVEQETFVNCADVVITHQDGSLDRGLVMPKIPPQAYQPIAASNHTLGTGELHGLEGVWDCDVPPPHGVTEKRNVYYEWCLENCLYALPHERSCPVETCRCFRKDKKLHPDEERQLLGVKDPYPVISDGKVKDMSAGHLEGNWVCDVASPFDQNPEKKAFYLDWCKQHCLDARPYERDCPETHCKCQRTDRQLSAEEIRRSLQKVASPQQAQASSPTTVTADDPNWKSHAKIRPQPNGLQGSWDCDVRPPYDAKPDKRLYYYEWCLTLCINAEIKDRYCAPTHCDCYRTDRKLSPEEIEAALTNSKTVVKLSTQEEKDRGIPPSLMRILKYAASMNTSANEPGLQGTWTCDVQYPFNQVEEKHIYYKDWCYQHCIKAQPNDRHCPSTHCRCYRTDQMQSNEENRKQLMVGYNVQTLIHSESGEKGSLAQNKLRPNIDTLIKQNEPPTNGFTCEVVPPFNDPARKDTVLKYCNDSCLLASASDRNCPTSHCKCYEIANPSNILQSAVKSGR